MSKVNFNDFEDDFEDEEETDAIEHDDRVTRRQKNRVRRKIEYLAERTKLRELLYTDDRYWGD